VSAQEAALAAEDALISFNADLSGTVPAAGKLIAKCGGEYGKLVHDRLDALLADADRIGRLPWQKLRGWRTRNHELGTEAGGIPDHLLG
jgi:hypothetical protein